MNASANNVLPGNLIKGLFPVLDNVTVCGLDNADTGDSFPEMFSKHLCTQT